MKIAILGGGFTGLTASYYLAKKGHGVTLFEKENVLGGLAVGFKNKNWNWYLERAYHHLLASENVILEFADLIGFDGTFFKEPETASLYEIIESSSSKIFPQVNSSSTPAGGSSSNIHSRQNFDSSLSTNNIFRIFPVDTPQDFLKLPLLSFQEKLRAGAILAFLKLSPFLSFYEKYTAQEFLKKTMGQEAWEILWQELFRKKFGKYADNILATFIWARIKKRSKSLGYIKGGFQTFIDYVEDRVKSLGVNIKKGFTVHDIGKSGEGFVINNKEKFDVVISTLPTIIMLKLTQTIFSPLYLQRFSKLKYLHAVVLILETKQPILDKTYWLNVCTAKIPIMIVAQHTNFIDKKYYGDNHLAYIGWYVNRDNPLLKMSVKQVLDFCLPYLKKISNNYELRTINYYLFHGPFAQPIFDKDFVNNKPDFITPVKNFFIANLDMTYPYDRGTNYAVKLGKDVAGLI